MAQAEFSPVKIIARGRKLPSRLPEYQQNIIRQLIAKNLKAYQIAKKVGVSRSDVLALMCEGI